MDLYAMTVSELCDFWILSFDRYQRWMYDPLLGFVQEWKQRTLSEETIKAQIKNWTEKQL